MKHPKYKTEAERKAAKAKAQKKYFEKDKEVMKEYDRTRKREEYRQKQAAKGLEVKGYNKTPKATQTELEAEIDYLRNENKVLLDKCNRLAKDNDRLKNIFCE